ncbi:site-specific DNA-methyltransferase [Antrihabitans sp. YC3-6]|uniref:Site-specific DNA-methyltransferase n=1 Tax=Antrihabitans stalagmiti TaxID=2799499 RepID=A0A934NTJ5_9NOCA|nr:site-specific DNA-methyltransferase [Antrihabitans stalagmiti]MBJ8341044.1 site-specific DNA-methyltransferase [Antrihabitans stalagmiti]
MPDESNVLDQLISRIDDETLRARLAQEVDLLRGSRRFGLVFDRHMPESVRLPDHPIRKGIRVALRDESSAETWTVERFADRTREVAVLSGEGGEHRTTELIVVREFGEPIYPGLRSVERIENGPADAPWHVVINGENFHTLQALRSTHREKVDLIYIDPPYNTGNDGWIYNDRYVDQNDRAKSSKWLSFIERRLMIARDLLKQTGVIIVAIGDDEHHRLRMLLDQVFGDQNFISDVVWQGGRKNDSRFVSNGADYMVIYAINKDAWAVEGVPVKDAPDVHALCSDEIANRGARWRVTKSGVEEVLAQGQKVWHETGGDELEATQLMRNWFREIPKDSPIKAMSRNVYFLPAGQLCSDTDITWPGGGGPTYEVLHPGTGKPVQVPDGGWRYSTPARMQQAIDEGWVIFRQDHTKPIRLKKPLEGVTGSVALSVFERQRTHGSRSLFEPKKQTGVFRDKRFPNPKDPEVLAEWIGLCTPTDAVVLDFFGGSGTTAEVVMRLNERDGGVRQSILVTNNEVGATEAKNLRKNGLHPGDPGWEAFGVFEHVCRPRISTVVTGRRWDGSVYSDGLSTNVEMFDLTYLDPGMVRRGREYESVAPLMWLEGGARGARIKEVPDKGWALTDTYGVLFDIDVLSAFSDAVTNAATNGVPPLVVFVITDSDAEYQQTAERLPVGIETVQLYEDYLSNYTINITGGAR